MVFVFQPNVNSKRFLRKWFNKMKKKILKAVVMNRNKMVENLTGNSAASISAQGLSQEIIKYKYHAQYMAHNTCVSNKMVENLTGISAMTVRKKLTKISKNPQTVSTILDTFFICTGRNLDRFSSFGRTETLRGNFDRFSCFGRIKILKRNLEESPCFGRINILDRKSTKYVYFYVKTIGQEVVQLMNKDEINFNLPEMRQQRIPESNRIRIETKNESKTNVAENTKLEEYTFNNDLTEYDFILEENKMTHNMSIKKS